MIFNWTANHRRGLAIAITAVLTAYALATTVLVLDRNDLGMKLLLASPLVVLSGNIAWTVLVRVNRPVLPEDEQAFRVISVLWLVVGLVFFALQELTSLAFIFVVPPLFLITILVPLITWIEKKT